MPRRSGPLVRVRRFGGLVAGDVSGAFWDHFGSTFAREFVWSLFFVGDDVNIDGRGFLQKAVNSGKV